MIGHGQESILGFQLVGHGQVLILGFRLIGYGQLLILKPHIYIPLTLCSEQTSMGTIFTWPGKSFALIIPLYSLDKEKLGKRKVTQFLCRMAWEGYHSNERDRVHL
jgi:hypothetical protein